MDAKPLPHSQTNPSPFQPSNLLLDLLLAEPSQKPDNKETQASTPEKSASWGKNRVERIENGSGGAKGKYKAHSITYFSHAFHYTELSSVYFTILCFPTLESLSRVPVLLLFLHFHMWKIYMIFM